MAYLLFVDESGSDFAHSPVAVLGGLAIEDRKVWAFVQAVKRLELEFFGMEYRHGSDEVKGKKFLNSRVFAKARRRPAIDPPLRRELARACLVDGSEAGAGITALAQAKLAFVTAVFDLCLEMRCRVFAALVEQQGAPARNDFLRKDYVYLLERFYYFLDDGRDDSIGIVVFDELENKLSKMLLDQMRRYFQNTEKGKHRAGLVLPEPFFVHSDLTTGIQVADLVCYAIGMGFRLPSMRSAPREELAPFVEQIKLMRYFSEREFAEQGVVRRVWSVTHLSQF